MGAEVEQGVYVDGSVDKGVQTGAGLGKEVEIGVQGEMELYRRDEGGLGGRGGGCGVYVEEA